MFVEYLFTYSRITGNIQYRIHAAQTLNALDFGVEELLDEILDYDGTEIWGRCPATHPMATALEHWCGFINSRYPDANINPTTIIGEVF